jgi:geranylgeranyl diphosphate synthase type II
VRYSLTVGGKRVRPVIVLATAEAAGVAPEVALPAGCALELVHTFSLVHDDLPSLDNDVERRGQPSTWKQYGEAVGILAGDALLAEAFRLATSYDSPQVARELAQATLGMIGGQYLDITGTAPDEGRCTTWKTGALFTAAVGLGLWAAASRKPTRRPGGRSGRARFALQIVDDILDGDGYVARHGLEEHELRDSRRSCGERSRVAADTSVLREIVDSLAVRTA